MADAFEPGDLVQLKSGGPRMTVERIVKCTGPGEYLHCQWFSGEKLEMGDFDLTSVKRVDSPEGK